MNTGTLDKIEKLIELRREQLYSQLAKMDSVRGRTWLNNQLDELERLSECIRDEHEKQPVLTTEDLRAIYETNGKIRAVKTYRQHYGTTLIQSKHAIERMAVNHDWQRP